MIRINVITPTGEVSQSFISLKAAEEYQERMNKIYGEQQVRMIGNSK